ncbi:MAG: hypothetical protein ACOCP8_08950 [archaeon]
MKEKLKNSILIRINNSLLNDLREISKEENIQLSTIIRSILAHYVMLYKQNNKDELKNN